MGDKVLVIGGGGREHAIAWKLARSNHVAKIFLAPGNAGTRNENKMENVPTTAVNPNDNESVVKYCVANSVDFVVVGPEAPLVNGITDALTEANVPCFGPRKSAAQIEASKAFAKDFMDRHGIPTARWQAFSDVGKACEHIRTAPYQALVVKASGLAAGKGVVVATDRQEAEKAAREMLEEKKFGAAGCTVVVEEKLEGEEVSMLAFTDGKTVAMMPPSQDHKTLLDGDQGPNTGGMGAYAPCPQVSADVSELIKQEVLQKTVDGMRAEGNPYVGVLYAGMMLTPDGPKVLEFNCRFGDPETQALLPLLKSDLYATMMECVNGELNLSLPAWHVDRFSVGVVLASEGYPGSAKKGLPIHGLESVKDASDAVVFHAGTTHGEVHGSEAVLTSGGRVLCVVGFGNSVQAAQSRAYAEIPKVIFSGVQYRKDIGCKAIRRAGLSYADTGVSIDAGNALVNAIKPLAKATARTGCSSELGGFAGLFDLKAAGYQDPLLVSGTDGVGTKLKVAQAVGCHDSVGIDLVAMCVNDILAHGAEPLFFLDYFACGKLDVGVAKHVISGIGRACSEAGCALLGGETAEMPGMYTAGEYDVAGFAVGAVERDQILPRSIAVGNTVIGLASSGIHSNGFSLVRRIVEGSGLSYSSASPFPVASGLQSVSTLGEALLEPTKIYCKAVLPLMQEHKVKAYAHITGGGLVENIPRVLPHGTGVVLNASAWDLPPVFGWLSAQGKVSTAEMARTFNCGVGAVLVVDQSEAAIVLERLNRSEGHKAWVIGDVVRCDDPESRVRIDNLSEMLALAASRTDLARNPSASVEGAVKKLKLSSGDAVARQRMRVGVLISGSGTNLQALIDQSLRHDSCAQIALVISNKAGVQGLERAKNAGIPTKVIDHKAYKKRVDFDMAVDAELGASRIELVCLAGFMRILTGEFVRKWTGRLVNIHPSLLPSFKGVDAHKQVLEAGVCISGCTVHFVAEEVDAGAIITQEAVPVHAGDTIESLQERVKTAEHRAYPRAMELLASKKIQLGADGKVVQNP